MDSAGLVVVVPVAGLWTSPAAPRPVDALAVEDRPDVAGWCATLDLAGASHPYAGRLGLHDRLESQLLRGEQVVMVEEGTDGWVRVVCPEQPSSRDSRGYPGWARRAHLGVAEKRAEPEAAVTASVRALLGAARSYAGSPYLWGGMTAYGIDCSGLVHLAARSVRIRLPRDAHDQQQATIPLAVEQARAGDLYFFARPGEPAHHVGIVTEPGVMLHAPQTGSFVVEEPLSAERRATLAEAGRLPGIR